MATTITQEFYNGKEWILVTSEILYNAEGQPTGHYKELSREYISKTGIFDDLTIQEEKLALINDYRNSRYNDYYVLKGNNYLEFYRAYTYGGQKSIGHAVLDFIERNQILVKSCERIDIFNNDPEPQIVDSYIDFICETRPTYKTFHLILTHADNLLVQVP